MSNKSEFSTILNQCRENFGVAPRRFGALDYFTYLRTPAPIWGRFDDLSRFFKRQKALLEGGDVVWGHTVQANSLLFQPSTRNCPGEVVYCADPSRDVELDDLSKIARQLYGLKGTRAEDDERQYIGDYLANEMIRVFGLPVPTSISPSLSCAISTVFFNRKHLPDRRLSNSFFPLLISRGQPRIAMVLPSRYWPERLQRGW